MKTQLSILMLLLIPMTNQAADCPPMTLQGNTAWLNNSYIPLESDVTVEFRGDNCKDQFFATADKYRSVDYSYMMSQLHSVGHIETDKNFHYSFSLDFAEILPMLGLGKNVDIFELYVLPDDFVSPNSIHSKVLSISVQKLPKPLNLSGFEWNVEVKWSGPEDSSENNLLQETKDIYFSGTVDGGLLHFNVNWNSHNLKGGVADVNVYSNLFEIDSFTGSQKEIDLNSSEGGSEENRVVFFGNNFLKEVAPSLFKIGIINSRSGVSFGDGIVFYTPWRE